MTETPAEGSPDPERRTPFSGLPLLTMGINLTLIAVVFLTRNRWEAWVVYGEEGPSHAFSVPEEVCFSYDPSGRGRSVALQNPNNTGRVLDRSCGTLAVLRGHEGGLTSSAFSPDARKVATESVDGTVRIWDAETGACLRVLQIGEGCPGPRAFSSDSRLIVTGCGRRSLSIWDTKTGARLAVMRGHTSDAGYHSFSPDGAKVLSASDDHTARLWDARSGSASPCYRGIWTMSPSPASPRTGVESSRDRTTVRRGSGTPSRASACPC